jgi:hypothetical protein
MEKFEAQVAKGNRLKQFGELNATVKRNLSKAYDTLERKHGPKPTLDQYPMALFLDHSGSHFLIWNFFELLDQKRFGQWSFGPEKSGIVHWSFVPEKPGLDHGHLDLKS